MRGCNTLQCERHRNPARLTCTQPDKQAVTTSSFPLLPRGPSQFDIDIYIDEEIEEEDDEEDEEEVPFHLSRYPLWKLGCGPQAYFMGQPGIYGEKFIRTRLAEEAAAAGLCGSR